MWLWQPSVITKLLQLQAEKVACHIRNINEYHDSIWPRHGRYLSWCTTLPSSGGLKRRGELGHLTSPESGRSILGSRRTKKGAK